MVLERSYKEKLKDDGFLQEKDKDTYVLRIVTPDGTVTAEQYLAAARAAERYGNGEIQQLPRMTMEIRGIAENDLMSCKKFLNDAGLQTGGTGARIRPIVCCKGTTCKNGQYDTYTFCRKIHKHFYEKYYDRILSHKFEIAVAGCPNNCVRSYFNDIGIVACKRGFKVYFGGCWTRQKRMGHELSGFVKLEGQVFRIIENGIDFYEANAKPRERFAGTVNRIGAEIVAEALLKDIENEVGLCRTDF